MNLAGRIILTLHLQTDHLGEFARQGIANNADDADCTTGYHGERQCIVARDDVEVAWLVLDDFIHLLQITRSLRDSNDVRTVVRQSDCSLCLHIHTRNNRGRHSECR